LQILFLPFFLAHLLLLSPSLSLYLPWAPRRRLLALRRHEDLIVVLPGSQFQIFYSDYNHNGIYFSVWSAFPSVLFERGAVTDDDGPLLRWHPLSLSLTLPLPLSVCVSAPRLSLAGIPRQTELVDSRRLASDVGACAAQIFLLSKNLFLGILLTSEPCVLVSPLSKAWVIAVTYITEFLIHWLYSPEMDLFNGYKIAVQQLQQVRCTACALRFAAVGLSCGLQVLGFWVWHSGFGIGRQGVPA
jgi:hypothetical protein